MRYFQLIVLLGVLLVVGVGVDSFLGIYPNDRVPFPMVAHDIMQMAMGGVLYAVFVKLFPGKSESSGNFPSLTKAPR